MTSVLALAVLLAPVEAGAPVPKAAPQAFDYVGLLEYAANGDFKSVAAEMVEWPAARIDLESRRLADDLRTPVRVLRFAVLVHTDTAVLAEIMNRDAAAAAHFRAARMLLPLCGSSEFDRRWRLAIGYEYEGQGSYKKAFEALQEALAHYPDDPEAFVAKGTLYEHVAAVPPSPLTSFAGTRRSSWEEAARLYERALTLRPQDAEAHLRLGRVYSCLGRTDDARRELTRALAASHHRGLVGYARLFLGEIEERENHLSEALAYYRAALDANPRLQPAHLALAAALQGTGRGAEATAVLVDGLRATRDGRVSDWLAYHTWALHGYEDAFERLWREARQ